MNRAIVFAVALAIGLVGQASAGTFYRYISPPTVPAKATAGIVDPNGEIKRGGGFTAEHLATGEYLVRFNKGFFPAGCAVMIVQTWGRSPSTGQPVIVGTAHVTGCESGNPLFHVHLRATDGVKRDDRFQFIAVAV